jgi:hypothetical protein
MKQYRTTSLFALFPVVEFSFKKDSQVYILKQRRVSFRADRFTLTLQLKGTRNICHRHFTFDEMRSTNVYLKDNPSKSLQPKNSIRLIYNCL